VPKLDITNDAVKFVHELPPKQFRQVFNKILDLSKNPRPTDSEQLKGHPDFFRADIGEYRIIYRIEKDCVKIAVVGKRNDSEIYKKVVRLK
jgi:mRNA interferase RelE/StbE